MSHKLCFLVLIFSAPFLAYSQINDNKPYFKDRVIIAKGDRQFAPFEFMNSKGEPDGFSVELFRELMKRLEIKYKLSLEDWDKVQQQLNNKEIDLAIGMIYSKERADKVKFGIPHCMISYNIICRNDNDYINLQNLSGKEIIVQKNDRAHIYLADTKLTDKIIVVDNIEDGVKLLASGRHDAVLSFDVSSFYFVRKGEYKNLSVHLTNIEPEKYSIVVNTDNEELLYLLNTAIYQMKIDGEYDRIYYKWFGVYEKTQMSKVLWYVLGALGVFVAILGLFVKVLKSKVNSATADLKHKNEESLSLVEELRLENQRRLEIEKNLILAKEKAEESDRLKSAFLANMSHEIRTPLNAIVGFSSVICETDDAKEREKFAKYIEKNNDLLLQLISDILDLSKIESGIMTINYSDFSLGDLCRQTIQTVQAGMNKPSVHLSIDLRCECVIWSDIARVSQVIINFLTNAIKFTPEGKIVLRAEMTQDGRVEISVIDSGIGIEEDKLQLVFERFVKLSTFSQGTGLGLSISKHIVEKLGGEIGVESQVGVGSRFWLRLPVME